MLAAALEAEANQHIAELAAETGKAGRRLVVRNGHHRPRTATAAAGSVEVTAPRVNDRRVDAATGDRMLFSSKILPPWCRKSPKVSQVLPLLYLNGLSSGDFVPALEQFLGSAAGLSSATATRLTKQWQDDHAAFQQRDFAESHYVYVWAAGVHPKVRLGQAHSRVLVLMGVRLDGTKELIALAEGLRKSTELWADLLRDCRRRGMRDPELVVGDGAMGLWKAPVEVFPAARHQRCWVHKGPEYHEYPAEVRTAGRNEGDAGDLQRRGPRPRREGDRGFREDIRRQVPQGRREEHRRPRRAAGVLRLPGRALDPSADYEPHRVDLLHRQAPHQGHPRRR